MYLALVETSSDVVSDLNGRITRGEFALNFKSAEISRPIADISRGLRL